MSVSSTSVGEFLITDITREYIHDGIFEDNEWRWAIDLAPEFQLKFECGLIFYNLPTSKIIKFN